MIGCPTQEQLSALLSSVMVVYMTNRSRAITSSSIEVSESPELVARKMGIKILIVVLFDYYGLQILLYQEGYVILMILTTWLKVWRVNQIHKV